MRRIIEISSPARLSIRRQQLLIRRDGKPDAQVPAEDISILVVDHPAVTYSQAVFTTLAEKAGAIVPCGADHKPAGTFLPLTTNNLVSARQGHQLAASKPLNKRLWKKIVQAKIRQQGCVLAHFSLRDHGLEELARRVKVADLGNLEAQAAQRYWPALLGPNFRRRRDGGPPNSLLNYGYTVLRAAVARALTGSGLLATHGIYHRRRDNPFCLADDLMEPFRPYIDHRVVALAPKGGWGDSLDQTAKAAVLGAFNDWVPIGDVHRPLSLAIHSSAASLARCFAEKHDQLSLPHGLARSEENVPTTEEDKGRKNGADDTALLADDVGSCLI